MKPRLTPEIYWKELKNYGLLDHFIGVDYDKFWDYLYSKYEW